MLNDQFKIKNLGNLSYFLGFEVARSKEGILLSQRKYALDLLTETGMLNAAPVSTPMNFSTKISSEGDPLEDPAAFRRLIGRLIYLTNTRPDITYVVHRLSQYVAAPTKIHHQAAFRIPRYIKQTPGQGILLTATNNLSLKAYSDSDWAGCSDSRKSTTGYIVYLGNSPISWKSKKQSTVSRSSSEAEYRALAQTVCELQWLTNLMKDLRLPLSQPATLYCDNMSAIKIATNQVFHERTKHIEIDCHLIRQKVQEGIVKLLPIHTTLQLADILTKPLPPSTFHNINSKLGTINIYAKLEGGCQSTINV
ncbi:uncharacterized protein LOC106760611 [Vigna radiata var. radiata]|uniref:Uncharacterized protein LOC106760611 n=1 Tax=Vigna radiata var. radiata TaxID=3916 RepID=A0A1S3U0I0_VIGRR|nr:uncharacterized protein LOC106760611 [Vigna radiata var. radiata]